MVEARVIEDLRCSRHFPALFVSPKVGNSPPLARLLGLRVRAEATESKSGPASPTKSYQLKSDGVGASS